MPVPVPGIYEMDEIRERTGSLGVQKALVFFPGAGERYGMGGIGEEEGRSGSRGPPPGRHSHLGAAKCE